MFFVWRSNLLGSSGKGQEYFLRHLVGATHDGPLAEPLPEEAAEVTMRREALRSILGALSPRERQVLELRYGLDGQQPRTLDEVGRAFNVTRERIRQIEHQSLKKLRALADAASVRDVA